MQIALLGSGMMGRAIAYDLNLNPRIDRILVCDIDMTFAQDVARFIGSDKIIPTWVDVRNLTGTRKAIEGSVVVISAIHYQFNYMLSKMAIEMGAHFIDLGGNPHVVGQQLTLNEAAKSKGVTIIPDTGLAPGMVQIITSHGASKFDKLENISIRVGGLPQNPKPPLNYSVVFSVEGLINEYVEDAIVIRDGRVQPVKSLTEVEEIIFPPPFGKLEAFQTAGGSSTLPITFYGRVKNLDYKTIRYPGHSQIFQTLISLGLCSSEEIIINGLKVTPRKITGLLLEKALRGEGKDAVLMSIAIDGTVGGKNRSLTYRMIDYYDDKTNLTAMMRSTGFPSAIIAQMLAEGKIEKKGVVPQELSVPPEQFVQEIARRNLKLEEIWN